MIGIFRRWVSTDMAIDLGTANTIIYVDKQGIVLNEPSVVAIEQVGNRTMIRDIGLGAKMMIGRTPGNIRAVRPMRDGVIADYQITEQMLNTFIKKVHGAKWFTPGPRIVICVPYSSTPVEQRAIQDSALAAGATKVSLISEPMAAAIGAELPIVDATGSMVVDIGGGTTEVGIVSLGGLVYANSIRVGGDKVDEAIAAYVRSSHGIAIGESTSEEIKKQIGSAFPEAETREMQISGHNIAEGVPRSLRIDSNEIREAISEPINHIVQAIKTALNQTPPELASDIANRGVVLTGGGALIRGLGSRVEQETGLPVKVAEDPLTCVARGSGAALRYVDTLHSVFLGASNLEY